MTEDASLRRELAVALPKGFTLSSETAAGAGGGIIVYDLDTQRPGPLRALSGGNFVIAVTARGETAPVMEAVSLGAYETLHRPIGRDALAALLVDLTALAVELKDTIDPGHGHPAPTCAIVGGSPPIMEVCKTLARLSQVDVPVLVTGETGTGKELIAESIAQFSARFGRPFVVINCAAMPETLLESELFGFEKGSFTGAVAAKEGLLKIADRGTVFFDEIGELPLSLQGKLLRFLQTQAFYPIGGTREVQVDVRVISATNRDIPGMVRAGLFREDLYHRLRVAEVHVPPLRERTDDILPLLRFFIDRYRMTAPRPVTAVSRAFLDMLRSYAWPGNIRELENTVRSAIALSKTNCLTTHELRGLGGRASGVGPAAPLLESLSAAVIPHVKAALDRGEGGLHPRLHAALDAVLIGYVLTRTGDNQSEAARILGINRLTLRKKLAESRQGRP